MSAQAGVRNVGNGGENIVCRDPQGKITSIELLDIYEGRILRGMTADLGPQGLNTEQRISYVLNRLKKINPSRAELYETWSDYLLANIY